MTIVQVQHRVKSPPKKKETPLSYSKALIDSLRSSSRPLQTPHNPRCLMIFWQASSSNSLASSTRSLALKLRITGSSCQVLRFSFSNSSRRFCMISAMASEMDGSRASLLSSADFKVLLGRRGLCGKDESSPWSFKLEGAGWGRQR